ncbi:MAG: hypothetical protein ACRCSN_10765 [Dermatophilaceae bacterium]
MNVRTLYLRIVPDDIVRRLRQLAERDATPVGVTAVRELSDISRHADDPAPLGRLPDLRVEAREIVAGIEQERAGRPVTP